MGLLEKALEYKKEINRKGKETLIDRIKGPAETEFLEDISPSDTDDENAGLSPEGQDIQAEEEGGREPDEIMDISEEIYEIDSTNDTAEKEDSLDIGDDILDDELFELPDDDASSPIDILKEQQERRAGTRTGAQEERKSPENGTAGEAAGYDDDSPIGPEDAPVIPKFGSIKPGEEKKSRPEKVPDIISAAEEKADTGEAGTIPAKESAEEADIVDAGPDSEKKAPAGEKEVGRYFDDEEDEEDEVVYTFDDFQDFPVLYEIIKDISRADTKDELYDVIIFSVNGQLGCSSSSIMIASPDDDSKWFIASSLGIEIREDLFFNLSEGILKNLRRNIIDIDDFKDDPECADQYEQFLSVDTKLITPIVFKKKLLGALILGEKITGEAYTEQEFGLILSVCNASATLFNKVATIERLNNESLRLKSDLDYSIHLTDLQDSILRNASIRSMEKIIQKEFEYLWVEYYAVFIKDNRDDSYIPFVVEVDDFLTLKSSGFKINSKNIFLDYIRGLEAGEKVEMFDKVEAVRSAFDQNLFKKMSQLWIYPFKVGKDLIGFITVFKIRDKILEQEIDRHLRGLTKTLFSAFLSIRQLDPEETRYVDNVELIFKRIGNELSGAKQMNIPLTIVLFSVKNFKRYASLYGYNESVQLINSCVDIIKSRLADTDFSARIDRNKIIIVLPGKDKKYAVPMANFLRNEIMQGFKRKEMQLLITFLMAEFPGDGEDLQTLLDSID
ncbi:MAG: diguanylate cyclase [Spirochaetes bacterium]|jgi:GGDEF domain-containing protein|nr:diguanylate cyclase [Spirochaetota bacterium]